MTAKIFGHVRERSAGSQDTARFGSSSLPVRANTSVVELPPESDLVGVLAGQYTAQSGALAAAVIGTPHWGADQQRSGANPAARALDAYTRLGSRFLESIRGRFALVLVDGKARTALLALDHMGMERLTYSTSGGALVFSDSASAVAQFSGVDAKLRNQAIFDYLLLHIVPAPETVYEGVFKLRPGTAVHYTSGGLRTSRFWTPRFVESGGESFASLKDGLQTSLRRAVEAANPDATTGAFLSGGLASSSVAGMLS